MRLKICSIFHVLEGNLFLNITEGDYLHFIFSDRYNQTLICYIASESQWSIDNGHREIPSLNVDYDLNTNISTIRIGIPDIDTDSFNSAYDKITFIYVPEQFLQSYIDTWLYPRKKSGAQYISTGLDGKNGYYGYLTCTCIIGYDNYDDLINYITGIKNPSINNDNVKKDKVYKISGHIVNKPSKGINIINGNKVLIK